MKHADLKKVIKELNDLGLEGIEKLRLVGVKTDAMVENFLKAIDEADDKGLVGKLPDSVVDAYNELTKMPEDKGEPVPEKTKETKETNAETDPVKKSQETAAAKGRGTNKGEKRSRYGHVQSALSGKLDDLLFAGHTVTAMMEATGVKRTRVVNHAKHLKNDKGLTVVETVPEGKDVKLNDTHYQVTEEVWTKD